MSVPHMLVELEENHMVQTNDVLNLFEKKKHKTKEKQKWNVNRFL